MRVYSPAVAPRPTRSVRQTKGRSGGGQQVLADRRYRSGASRRVPRGHPQALQRRADPDGAARQRRAPRPLAHDARVRRRPGDDRASADRDRALRLVERRQAPRGARAAALRDARGAARPPARAGRGARAHADGARSRVPPRLDALQVALLAHVRLAHDRAARGRLRRAGGRGAPGARDRAGRLPGRPQRPPAEVRRLGRGAPLGSGHAHRVAGLPHVRGAPRGLVDVPVPGARAAREPGRRGRARRHARARRSSRSGQAASWRALGAQRARLVRRAAAVRSARRRTRRTPRGRRSSACGSARATRSSRSRA